MLLDADEWKAATLSADKAKFNFLPFDTLLPALIK
jgi:hypothetical protein